MERLIIGVIILLVASLVVCHIWHGIEDDRRGAAEYNYAMEHIGQRAEPFEYNMPLPAKHPTLFPIGLSLGVFLIGLLVIIANNTSTNPTNRQT